MTFQLATRALRFILGSTQSRYKLQSDKKKVGLALCILIFPELMLCTLHGGIKKLPARAAAQMYLVEMCHTSVAVR